MEYKNMMEDCVRYLGEHGKEERTAKNLCQVYSCTEEYFVYLFRTYFELAKDWQEDYFPDGTDESQMKRRQVDQSQICVRYQRREEIVAVSDPVLKPGDREKDPAGKMERTLLSRAGQGAGEQIAFWWHDKELKMYYLVGRVLAPEEDLQKGARGIYIPEEDYAVFSFKGEEFPPAEAINTLVNYIFKDWVLAHPGRWKERGYTFASYADGHMCFYLPLLSVEDREEKKDRVYGVDTWIRYIDKHILDEVTVSEIAKKFHYSPQHFRHVFRLYYNMSVTDYIRKKRLHMAAKELRERNKPLRVALKYGFTTLAGFSRAFEQEFQVTPGAYGRGDFEVIDLAEYYMEYKDTLKVSVVDVKEIKMIGHTVIPDRGRDVDIPAQIHYWLDKDFPCLKNTRFSCNKLRREDKIAMWYHVPEYVNIEYILGPVVDSFEGVPQDMRCVTIEGGRYAIFETGKTSDMDDVPETLRMFSRCVFYGWVKEHRDEVDLMRFTFERYRNSKIYLYVPIKRKK